MKMLLPFLILSICLLSCNNQEDNLNHVATPTPLPTAEEIAREQSEKEEYFRKLAEENLEKQRVEDSIKKATAATLPIACTFIQDEDANFNKFLSVTIKNNTNEIVKTVQLNIKYNPYQGGLGQEKYRLETLSVNLYPGKTKKVRLNEELLVADIIVLKYYGNKSGKNYNGPEAALDAIDIEARKINPLYGQGF